jgi:cation diffusion facilitator CzcD-associated flavoprotein CzcO
MAPETTPVAVVGAGPAGLAACIALGRRGVRAVALERSDSVAAAWRARPDCLRLNSSRAISRIDQARLPRSAGTFASRDAFVAHLERLADERRVAMRLRTCVDRVDRTEDGWELRTSSGPMHAGHVVVATGYAGEPWTPAWPGRDRFAGRLLHAAEYREPGPFRGTDVLVVGPGSSGMEIAHDMAVGGAARVRLAVRTPPNILLRLPGDRAVLALLRLPPRVADRIGLALRRLTIGDLAAYGLPVPEEGPFSRNRRLGVAPAVVDREVIAAIRSRRIEVVAGVAALDDTAVLLDDGSRIQPDTVISATGYRTGLEPLVGHLGVLDRHGGPRVTGGREALPGLRFVGYVPQPGILPRMGAEARRAAQEIALSAARPGPAR